MIVWKEGRPVSIRTGEERKQRVRAILNSLSEEEKKIVKFVFADLMAVEKNLREGDSIVSRLEDLEYQQKPVSLEEFLFNDYFLGRHGRRMFPKLVDDFFEFFTNRYYLAILTGAIGYGKTFWVSCCLARILYELSCLRNPQLSLGVAPGTVISIVNMSVTLRLAQKVVFETLANFLEESPYFKEEFKFERTASELRFPNNIWLAPVTSSDTSVLGLNVYTGVMDETNFYDLNPKQKATVSATHQIFSKAEDLLNALMRRMRSRYMDKGGLLSGYLFLLSSVRSPDDFIFKKIKELEKDDGVFVRSYAVDEVKPVFINSPKFKVFVGNERVYSRIITEENKEEVERLLKTEEGVFVVEVAEEFRPDFERDVEGALRDIKGIVIRGFRPYLTQRDKILKMIKSNRAHPFTSLEYNIDEYGDFIWERLVTKKEDGRMEPIVNPSVPRHIHIDLGLKRDSSALCMAHISGYKEVEKYALERGKYREVLPIIFVDFILRIKPPKGGEIQIADIRQLVYKLSMIGGFQIGLITMDSFQSADSIQIFQRMGFPSKVLSVESIKVYEVLKNAIYEERIDIYYYEPLIEELKALEFNYDKRKVDHPKGGSKDLADALAGVVYSLTESSELQIEPLPILKSEGEVPLPFLTANEEEQYIDLHSYWKTFFRR